MKRKDIEIRLTTLEKELVWLTPNKHWDAKMYGMCIDLMQNNIEELNQISQKLKRLKNLGELSLQTTNLLNRYKKIYEAQYGEEDNNA